MQSDLRNQTPKIRRTKLIFIYKLLHGSGGSIAKSSYIFTKYLTYYNSKKGIQLKTQFQHKNIRKNDKIRFVEMFLKVWVLILYLLIDTCK